MNDRHPRRTVRRVAVISVTAALGVVLVALAVLAFVKQEAGSEAAGPMEPLSGPDPGMGHVYALAVDPGDSTLYAGTRYGLFRIGANGQATRVANRHQEIKALAALGPGHLLASGHPDPRENLPTRLGLVESTDGGVTWQLVSLAGQADFHTLTARHDLVYGYDSSSRRFLVTLDRERWDPRAELPMAGVAVSPSDAAVVLAVSERRLMRSTDGGRTFTPIDPAPELAALTWPMPDVLFGVRDDGRVYLSGDAGTTWSARGRVDGVPQAIVAADSSEFFVATDTGIYISSDGGQMFALRYREQ